MASASQILPQVKVQRRESGDCAVVALSIVLNLPFEECKDLLRHSAEYAAGQGTRTTSLEVVLQELGFKRLSTYFRTTLRELTPHLLSGRWYVLIQGHAFAVINGVIHDNRIYRRSPYVRSAWKLP